MKEHLKRNKHLLYVLVFLFHPFLTTALEPQSGQADTCAGKTQSVTGAESEKKELKDVAGREVVAKSGPVRELYLEAPAEVRLLDAEGHILPAGKEARLVVISGLKPGSYHLRDETGKLRKLRIR
jgi:hypothetical protein